MDIIFLLYQLKGLLAYYNINREKQVKWTCSAQVFVFQLPLTKQVLSEVCAASIIHFKAF